ncbi:MAG TPA: glyoxylate/hydroxypyruvate reductase A [Burkholderiaceae bacterium]
MRILLYTPDGKPAPWLEGFAQVMPEAQIDVWSTDVVTERGAYDYAVLWRPPAEMLADCAGVKAIFNLGAGVDAILKPGVDMPAPVVRLDDAGMGVQMAEYVTHAVLRYFRRFGEYEEQAKAGVWQQLPQYDKADFTVGILGLGVLGTKVAAALGHFGFPLRAWTRSEKAVPGVECFTGTGSLDAFLAGTRVLVCMLPLTAETTNLLNRARLSALPQGAYLINVARGAHVAEPDLLGLIASGHIAGATLDVFRHEPLPAQHPFWQEPRITITPHMSALTMKRESIEQIALKINVLERGETVAGMVDMNKGY